MKGSLDHQAVIKARYREAFHRPDLTPHEMEAVRRRLQAVARIVCEHVWGEASEERP